MIHYDNEDRLFHLQTENSSYVLQILSSGHPAHIYYGKKIRHNNKFQNLLQKKEPAYGSSTSYSEKNHGFSLNFSQLEYSSYGKGDYRDPPISLLSADGNRTFDFLYKSHEIFPGRRPLPGLPSSHCGTDKDVETLELVLFDKIYDVTLTLSYCIFPQKDIITRNVSIENGSKDVVIIDKISSFSLDFDHFNFDLITLDGAWIRERHSHRRKLQYGNTIISSRKGVSSPDHNPFLILCDPGADETKGESYGFALMYSGNHSCSAEVNTHDNTRVQLGINDFDFNWKLEKNCSFQTPEAVLSYSDRGLNGLSRTFHNFIRNNVVRGEWQFKERPVLINNWEATYFDFNETKLLKLATEAKELGMELFVLDDGWFGKRDSDKTSLGDWSVNLDKLPGGIKGLADKINKIGLDFGIWVEPEMISINSDLYKEHPQWMIRTPLREPSPGRFQYLLDFTNREVRDYIYESMRDLFLSAQISYVKWDMNRNFSDVYSGNLSAGLQKEFSHRYVLGLYEILEKLTTEFPHILFESCASGGGRFDMAMFCYMPQIWTSDDTDGVERLFIQQGSSMLAPLSVMGAHVSAVPNHQVLRNTPIETRFNTAAFGLLGYELDLTVLSDFEKKAVKKQIEFYKEHRKLMQFGNFYRLVDPSENGNCLWMVVSEDKEKAILGYFQILAKPNPAPERYRLKGLDENILYEVQNRAQYNEHFESETTLFTAYGDQLMNRGFIPVQQFYGTGVDKHVSLLGDFGSRLFVLSRKKQ